MNGLLQKVYDFVDERIDLKTLEAKMMNEPIKGGSRWAYVFGSCLLFIFIMQAITGILLMFYYIPSADHAYASTQYVIHEVDYGWFILSYHFWGSSAMVVMVFAHMSQVFLWGAYKKPREMIWLVGLALFGLVMAFGFTGYLLPWDQRAYWATTVGVEIMDKTPIVGDFLARFLKGGATPDPGDYHPEPEWYFLFLFQILRWKIFSGELGQFLGAIAIPGAFMALLAALPFIDRKPERNIFRRPIALASWFAVTIGIVVL